MKITINGQEKELNSNITLSELISTFSKNPDRVVVEVNGNIIKSSIWKETTINESDTIELVTFVGGG